LTLDPNDSDATAQLADAKHRMQLPGLYKLAQKAILVQHWQAARTSLEQIWSIDPNYRETKQWMERVTAELWKLAPRTRIGNDGKEMILVPPGEFVMGSNDGKEMILVPPGEFVMGSNEGHDNEKPPHKVYLDAFYIARYPVTNAEYKKFVDATKHAPPSHWSNGQIPAGKENHPVTDVTWDDAVAYAQWAGARLPTEAEWEKAASWDDAKKVKRVFPWGDTFDANKCNSAESKIGGTTPVGKYSPNGDSFYGIADMAGNVWEWCADWYDENYYRNSPVRNPKNETAGSYRVLRSGSWSNNRVDARCAYRYNYFIFPHARVNYVGFRVAESSSALGSES
jgi:iron(II)-dependent oxidoreductase